MINHSWLTLVPDYKIVIALNCCGDKLTPLQNARIIAWRFKSMDTSTAG